MGLLQKLRQMGLLRALGLSIFVTVILGAVVFAYSSMLLGGLKMWWLALVLFTVYFCIFELVQNHEKRPLALSIGLAFALSLITLGYPTYLRTVFFGHFLMPGWAWIAVAGALIFLQDYIGWVKERRQVEKAIRRIRTQ